MQVLGPISGGWWWHHHWTRLSYRKWHCSNLFFWKGKRQISFFKVYHPSTEKPKALVGFELRTEPELGTGDSHSTSTPPPPTSWLCSGGVCPSASCWKELGSCYYVTRKQKLCLKSWMLTFRSVAVIVAFSGNVQCTSFALAMTQLASHGNMINFTHTFFNQSISKARLET